MLHAGRFVRAIIKMFLFFCFSRPSHAPEIVRQITQAWPYAIRSELYPIQVVQMDQSVGIVSVLFPRLTEDLWRDNDEVPWRVSEIIPLIHTYYTILYTHHLSFFGHRYIHTFAPPPSPPVLYQRLEVSSLYHSPQFISANTVYC